MIETSSLLSILIGILCFNFLHFVGDFYLQTNNMAMNKSTSWKWLTIHALVYSIPFIFTLSPLFILINGFSHFWVDYITSKITKKLWAKGDLHNFFVVIGFDQFIHSTIILTLIYFFSK